MRVECLLDDRVDLLQRAPAALRNPVLGLRAQVRGVDAVARQHGGNHAVVRLQLLHNSVVAHPRQQFQPPTVGTSGNALLASGAEVQIEIPLGFGEHEGCLRRG
jgi:hypothetical protein